MVIIWRGNMFIEKLCGIATGGANMNNKGGINCFIRAGYSRFLFTAVHLSSSRESDGPFRRNSDLQRILN